MNDVGGVASDTPMVKTPGSIRSGGAGKQFAAWAEEAASNDTAARETNAHTLRTDENSMKFSLVLVNIPVELSSKYLAQC
jgi:hypothetical protein